MTASRHLTCPRCHVTHPDGEFTTQQRVDSYRLHLVVGVDADGLRVDGLDHTYGDPRGPMEIVCGSCGHQWATTRSEVFVGGEGL